MTQDLIDQLRGLLAKSTPGPWVRANLANITTRIVDGGSTVLGVPCLARYVGYRGAIDDDLATEAVNALPGLLDTIEAQARRIETLTAALEQAAADFEDIAQLALRRIDDGEDLGARVWRIALQDIAKEADDDRQDVLAAVGGGA